MKKLLLLLAIALISNCAFTAAAQCQKEAQKKECCKKAEAKVACKDDCKKAEGHQCKGECKKEEKCNEKK